jgi:hypothetical protein
MATDGAAIASVTAAAEAIVVAAATWPIAAVLLAEGVEGHQHVAEGPFALVVDTRLVALRVHLAVKEHVPVQLTHHHMPARHAPLPHTAEGAVHRELVVAVAVVDPVVVAVVVGPVAVEAMQAVVVTDSL